MWGLISGEGRLERRVGGERRLGMDGDLMGDGDRV